MKFLCVPCDSPMKLQSVGPPERGSLSIVYACPECGYEMAMLTNAYETQVVQSLGVRVGPENSSQTSSASGGCPFPAMIPAIDEARRGQADEPVRWTAAAEARLANIPGCGRPHAASRRRGGPAVRRNRYGRRPAVARGDPPRARPGAVLAPGRS